MTSSTTPQDRAAELIRKFIVTNVGYDAGHLMTVQAQELTILLGDAGLLSSGTQEEGGGSLRSGPSADGASQWAVLRDGEDYVYYDESMARTVLAGLLDDGEDSFSLYEIHEVTHG